MIKQIKQLLDNDIGQLKIIFNQKQVQSYFGFVVNIHVFNFY